MSITKRLSVKAAKPQDQTSECKPLPIIEAILDEKTTELSKAIDDAVIDSMVYGTGGVVLKPGAFTSPSFNPDTVRIRAKGRYSFPRPVEIKRTELEVHPVFELTVEQLRSAWMLTYGNRWVSMEGVAQDEYMEKVSLRLQAFGELEVHNVIDQYSPMARIKL